MHGYAVARDDSGAADFLARLEAGEFSVSPGRSCYGGLILAYIRSHAWSDALSTYEIMKREKIAASAPTNHGLVLSAYRKGGRSRVELIVEDIVDHDGKVGQKTCILALSLLLPEMGNVKGISLREVQRKIREFGAETGNEHAIELCRSLRIAEVEQHRATEKDHDAWKLVLKSILSTSKAQACAYL